MTREHWKNEVVNELRKFGITIPTDAILDEVFEANHTPEEAYGICCDLSNGWTLEEALISANGG